MWSEHFPDSLCCFSKKSREFSEKIFPDWLAGFADGDGSFYTTIRQQKDYPIGFQF